MTKRVSKTRYLKGQDQPMAKLTDAEVIRIRHQFAAGNVTQKRLALYYGVANQTISKVVTGRKWKHLPGPITRTKIHKGVER